MKITILFLLVVFCGSLQAQVITVPAGGDLQAAMNAAQSGGTVVVEAGAVFTGNFVVPVKSGSSFITIRSSRCDEIPVGVRVSPAQSALMTTIATATVDPTMRAPVFSSYFRFQCIQFTQSPQLATDPVAGFAWSYNLIQLGDGGAGEQQTTIASAPHHLEFDRVIVRPRDGGMTQRGITLNSASTTIINSWIGDIKWPGTETQAIGGYNGPGPFTIENNYLESASMAILFGGANTLIPDLVPSDITIRNNTLTKRLDWQGKGYVIKNCFELKNARRVTFTNNICTNVWPEAQTGWAVILNALADSPQHTIEDIDISHNVFSNVANGINLRGMDTNDTVSRMHRIRIADNLIEGIGAFNGEGKAFQVLNGAEGVSIDHNTVRGIARSALLLDSFPTVKMVGLVFTNNLMPHGEYGIFGNGGFFGTAALNQFASGWTATGNALYAKPSDPTASLYPSGNYFPATEAESVGLLGTDGLPVGVRGSVSIPNPSPTPSAIPTPAPTPAPSPSPTPAPSPSPSPTPVTCTMTTNSPVLAQWATGKLVLTFTDLLQPSTVTVAQTSGQVVVVPPTVQTITGTSTITEFLLQSKKKSSGVVVSGPCGTRTVDVIVR